VKILKFKISIDWVLVIVPILLAIASVATLYSITSISGKSSLAIDQITYFVAAIVVYVIFMAFDYRILKSYSWYLYLLGLILLVAVVFFGQTILGSKRWIDLGFTQFQPSELVKFILLIFSANFITSRKEISVRQFVVFLALVAIPIILVMLQPDLGTALSITALLVGVIAVSKIPKKFFLPLLVLFIIAAPIGWMNLKPYQKQRIETFMNPSSDPLGAGYNVLQSRIAVGSGGLYGKGFGQTTQSQLQFLPIAYIDFIFSGWAEATGFLGSVALVGAYSILVWRIFVIAGQSRDDFGLAVASGIGAVILFQSLVNIGMNVGLLPVTGIPLPLVSYGGTSVVVNAAFLGIVQSIYLRKKALKFD